MDEATASLDSESEALIQEAMERLMTGRTVIVVAHRLSTVRALDRLLVFERGRVAEDGPHERLLTLEGGIYRRLYERQAMGGGRKPALLPRASSPSHCLPVPLLTNLTMLYRYKTTKLPKR